MLLIWKFYVDVIDSGNYICWIGEMFWIWEVNVFLGKVLKKSYFGFLYQYMIFYKI